MSLMEYLQNPGSNPALQQGLLQFGMSLLGQPGGNLLGSISRAGLAGLGGYQAADEQMRQRSMQEQQLAFQKAQQEAWQKAQAQKEADDASQRKAIEGAYVPGQWTGANPYAAGYENSMDSGGAVNMTPGQFDMQRYAESLAQAGNPLALQAFQALKKPDKPLIPLSEGASLFDQNTGRIVVNNPKTPKEDAFIALMRQSGIDPESPHGRALLAQRLAKETTHAPPASTNITVGDAVPHQVVKQQDEMIDRIFTARSIDADLGAIETQIASGKLDFGPVTNAVSAARNELGASNEQSRNFATFKSSLERLRNDSLRLNNGVQTEGDAQRAWGELFQSINDKKLVQQRLKEIRALNQRAAMLQEERLRILRGNFGAAPIPSTPIPPAITPQQAPGVGPMPTPDAIRAEIERRKRGQ